MISVLILAAVSLASSPTAWAECPCYPYNGNYNDIICEDTSLTSIPDCVPDDILMLSIKTPSIPLITETIRRFTNLSRLNVGYFDANPKISKSFLSGHENLKFFEVFRTQLDYVDKDWFIFTPNIRNLVFSSNRIPSLDSTVFSNLPLLEEIRIHSNLLTTMPANIFENNSMNYLLIENNPFRCDCDMFTFMQWARDKGMEIGNKAYCSYPLELKGVNVNDLPAYNRC